MLSHDQAGHQPVWSWSLYIHIHKNVLHKHKYWYVSHCVGVYNNVYVCFNHFTAEGFELVCVQYTMKNRHFYEHLVIGRPIISSWIIKNPHMYTFSESNWVNASFLVSQGECCRFFYMKNTTEHHFTANSPLTKTNMLSSIDGIYHVV